MRKRGRVDASQPELVKKLRASGKSVIVLSSLGKGVPDILIGGHHPCPKCKQLIPQNRLVELKELGGKMTGDEELFMLDWRGQRAIWFVIRQGNQIIAEENGNLVQFDISQIPKLRSIPKS